MLGQLVWKRPTGSWLDGRGALPSSCLAVRRCISLPLARSNGARSCSSCLTQRKNTRREFPGGRQRVYVTSPSENADQRRISPTLGERGQTTEQPCEKSDC